MECNDEEREGLRSLVGQLGRLCTNSRSDLSYDVLELSCKVNNPKVEDLIEANKCLRTVYTFESSMYFPGTGDASKNKLMVYSDTTKYKLVVCSDAPNANLPDGLPVLGDLLFFFSGRMVIVVLCIGRQRKFESCKKHPCCRNTGSCRGSRHGLLP